MVEKTVIFQGHRGVGEKTVIFPGTMCFWVKRPYTYSSMAVLSRRERVREFNPSPENGFILQNMSSFSLNLINEKNKQHKNKQFSVHKIVFACSTLYGQKSTVSSTQQSALTPSKFLSATLTKTSSYNEAS